MYFANIMKIQLSQIGIMKYENVAGDGKMSKLISQISLEFY